VIVLTTGGTIGHRFRDGVAVMDFDPERLLSELGPLGVDVEFRAIFRKGSMDIVPSDWRAIAAAISVAAADRPRGIVVLHGTDTMHYTAAALSFMLQGLSLPVVLSGSMNPGGEPGSDAIPNLHDAILVAVQSDLAEVCIVFSADDPRSKGVIIRGCRARKCHSHAVAAFASIGSPPIGFVSGG
jgi:glutamyl-tRNA(Gln) amidotransferase subunit D